MRWLVSRDGGDAWHPGGVRASQIGLASRKQTRSWGEVAIGGEPMKKRLVRRGHSRVPFLLGSTAEELLVRSNRPVLVARDEAS